MRRSVYVLAILALFTFAGRGAYASPTDDVRNAMLNFVHAESYRMTFPSRSGETAWADYGGPGKVHMVMGPVEMIELDGVAYMKMGGTWRKLPHALPATYMADVVRTRDAALHSKDYTATDLGMKPSDGELLHAYSVQKAGDDPHTVYIGSDGFIHRIDTNSGYIRFSNFNKPVNISAPM